MNDKGIIGGVIVLLLAVGAVLFATSGSGVVPSTSVAETASAELVAFARCLNASGVTFYGAFWCPHCKEQKAMFSSAVSELPYVECSTPDGNSQTEVCKAKGIKSYPTWIFTDGTELSGVQTFADLAKKTSCQDPTPGAAVATSTTATSTSATVILPSVAPGGAIPKSN